MLTIAKSVAVCVFCCHSSANAHPCRFSVRTWRVLFIRVYNGDVILVCFLRVMFASVKNDIVFVDFFSFNGTTSNVTDTSRLLFCPRL